MKKFMLRVMPIVLVVLVMVVGNVYALDPENTFNTGNVGNIPTATKLINNVWGTVLTILQVLAVAAIVFSGVKYMFAGADEKASIKSGLLVLAIGAILVFGASTVVKLLVGVVNEAGN